MSLPLLEPPFVAMMCSRRAMDGRIRTVLPNESTLISCYWQNWGRQGDLGLVAESDSVGYPVSCAWVRLFSREEAGADYVGDNIPESRSQRFLWPAGWAWAQEFCNLYWTSAKPATLE